MTEKVLCALIGVGGTLLGTIVGLVFPYLCSGFGRKLFVISDIDVRFGTGKPDGEGGYDGSWINPETNEPFCPTSGTARSSDNP